MHILPIFIGLPRILRTHPIFSMFCVLLAMLLTLPQVSAEEQQGSRVAQLLGKIPAEPKAPPVAAPLGDALPPLEFYQALQPGVPGLEAVYEAVQAADVERAQSAFATYLRTKEFDPDALSVLPAKEAGSAKTSAGEAAAARKITLLGKTHTYRERIDWTGNPTEFSDWPLLLNRHGHWRDLALAYEQTGNPAYLKAFAEQLDSWLTGARMPGMVLQAQARNITRDKGHRRPFAPAWRTIEVGERLRDAWPKAFGTFVRQPGMDDATLVRMAAAMIRQADFLVEYQGPQNWFALENEGLLRTSVIFPEFSRARVWKDEALGRIAAQLDEEVYPDGTHIELTPWYQETVRKATSGIVALSQGLGLDLSPSAGEKFEKLHLSTMAAVQPDGRAPQVNDADPLRVEYILREGAKRFNRPEMLYVASRGREGTAPSFFSTSLPWAGWAVMRSDWGENANYLFFEGGPFGGHAHEDKLGFILFAYGQPFVIDTGRSSYSDGSWRSFNIGPNAHSTVLFDGKGQSRRYWTDNRLNNTKTEAEGFEFATTEQVDYASGAFGEMADEIFYDANLGFAFIAQRRVVLFLKPDRWVVLDSWSKREGHPAVDQSKVVPESFEPKEMTTLFQLEDLPTTLKAEEGRLTMGQEGGPLMGLSWTQPGKVKASLVRGREEPSILGWRFLDMNQGNRAVPINTLVLDRSLPGETSVNGYLFSATAAGVEPRQESITLAASEEDGTVFHLMQGEQVFAEIKLNANPATPFSWKGETLKGRVVLEWNGQRQVFP